MKRFTAVEWQSFALKKDIEIIVDKLKDNQTVQFSLLVEVVLVILGVALANIFNGLENVRLFWIILSILCIIPLCYNAIYWINAKRKERERGSDKMNKDVFIDIFDNAITYFILISESYYSMLMEALSHNNSNEKKIPDNVIHFYYIQTSYYFRKAIVELIPLYNIVGNVLSFVIREIEEGKYISLPRYFNAKNLLSEIFEYIEKHKDIIEKLDEGNLIINLNENSNEDLNRIHKKVLEWFEEVKKEK